MKLLKNFAIAATVVFGALGSAQAGTVDLTTVDGAWTGLQPNNNRTDANGLGTSTVRWGTPFNGPGGTGEQSGYNFTGSASGTFEANEEFDLGTFTHYNKTINIGTSITGATLGLAVGIVIGGVPQAIAAAFTFDHNETPNNGIRGRCANGRNNTGVNVNGCADRVRVLDNAGSTNRFVVEGITYILEITGFVVNGQPFSQFWTTERADNSAVLRARFREIAGSTSAGGDGGTPSPVPLPGAAWLILSALGAMAVVGRKRQTA